MVGDATLADASTGSDADAPDSALARGEQVGRYVVLDPLGQGGMGSVYAAYDPQLDRRIALKLLHTPSGDPATHRRLLGEAQAMARLSHPNTVTIYDVGEHLGRVFLAIELVDGMTLRAWLRARERNPRAILAVLLAAGRGLAAAHEAGIVHRDFKPDNVLIAERPGQEAPRVCVTDFGLAVLVEGTVGELDEPTAPSASTSTAPTRWAGTPAYMAPEQHRRTPVGIAADQFSFCVTAIESLSGARPFAGDSAHAVAAAILSGDLVTDRGGRPIATRIRRALVRGLAPDPAARWPSLSALLDELERASAPRTARYVALAGAVVLAGALGSWQLERARLRSACASAGAELAAVWDPRAIDRVRTAMTAAGIEPEDVLARVGPPLSAYAAELGAQRERLCTRVELDHDVQPGWTAAVEACLDEHHAAAEALVEVLATPDRRTPLLAVSAAAGLPPLVACTDDRVLSRRMLPSDPAQRAEVAARRAELAAINQLVLSGRMQGTTERMEAARVAVDALGYAPLVAEARHVEAGLRDGAGDSAAARTLDEESYYLALGSGADDIALDAALELVYVVGYRLGETAPGLEWSRTAAALIERFGLADDIRNASLQRQLGSLYSRAGDYPAAVAVQEGALELEQRLLGEDHPDVATTLDNLGNAYSALGRTEDAVPLQQRALEIRERLLGPEHPDVARSLLNLGTSEGRSDRLDDAARHFERALALAERSLGPTHPMVANAHGNLGVISDQLGHHEVALVHALATLAIYEAKDPAGIDTADSLNNVGASRLWTGEHALAELLFARAVALYGVHGGKHPAHPTALVSLAMLHVFDGRFELAERELAEAEQRTRDLLGPGGLELAAVMIDRAEVATGRGQLARARELEDGAERMMRLHGGGRPTMQAELYYARGWTAFAAGEHAAAIAALEHALAVDQGRDALRVHERTMWLLARSLDAAGRDPARAVTLARDVADTLSIAGPGWASVRAEIERWLGSRRADHPQ